jgi:Carbohydrate-selective porin, OprB family
MKALSALCLFLFSIASPKPAIALTLEDPQSEEPVPSVPTLLDIQPIAPMAQSSESMPSVSQLSDVQPSDWAFQALQSLVERYNCLEGDRNGFFQGDRALTRYEFAAGVNACLNQMSTLISQQVSDVATQADLQTLSRLQQEFATELSTLRGRVDTLEARTAELEANQFSTTIKLSGDVLFQVADVFGQDVDRDNNTVLQSRLRLTLDTSFTGSDRLRLRLQSGNFQPFTQPGREVSFGYSTNTSGTVQQGVLNYQFPVNDRVTAVLYANGDNFQELTIFNPINPFDQNAARGASSRFAALPPIYRTANTNAGVGVNWNLTPKVSFAAGYLAGKPGDPNEGGGLFNGNYGAIARLLAQDLFGDLDLTLVYIHSYTGTTPTSSGLSFLTGSQSASVSVGRPLATDSYGLGANWQLSPRVQLGGWVGLSQIRAIGLGDAEVWNYGLGLALPDLGGEGNLAGLVVGMEPRLTESTDGLATALGRRRDPDVGMHVEAFYRITLNDHMDITPGIIYLTAPNHDEENAPILVGVLRSTFRF